MQHRFYDRGVYNETVQVIFHCNVVLFVFSLSLSLSLVLSLSLNRYLYLVILNKRIEIESESTSESAKLTFFPVLLFLTTDTLKRTPSTQRDDIFYRSYRSIELKPFLIASSCLTADSYRSVLGYLFSRHIVIYNSNKFLAVAVSPISK